MLVLVRVNYKYMKHNNKKFKRGDKVITDGSNHLLSVAGVYTVDTYHEYDQEVWLVETNGWYPISMFELYNEDPKPSTKASEIITKYRYAEFLVGKKVTAVGREVVVESVGLDLSPHDNQSNLTRAEYDKLGYSVYVKYDSCRVPVDQVKLIEHIDVKLNKSYTAKVNAETITVGCQTFPVSILADLSKAVEQFKDNNR